MKNGAFVVFKKELARFFGDKRLLFTSVIMPGLLIYFIYTVMGNSLASMLDEKTSSFKAAAVNMPQSISAQLSEMNFEIDDIEASGIDNAKQRVTDGDYALCCVFPDDFDNILALYADGGQSDKTPNVEIYYNSAEINSANAFAQISAVLDAAEKNVSNVFDVNSGDGYDLASEEDTTGTILSMILPMLLIALMYSSCVALAPESIAGEKERGTIAALLITPVPRSQIILGKVAALSVMALLGGCSSFLGTFLSIPVLMESMGEEAGAISTDVYGAAEYIWLIILILTTILLFVTVISIISTLAKSVKEAGTMVMPLMIVIMLVGFLTMYSDVKEEIYWYLVPVFNTVESMAQVFSFMLSPAALSVTAAANIVYSALGIFLLTKLFDNERVMFN